MIFKLRQERHLPRVANTYTQIRPTVHFQDWRGMIFCIFRSDGAWVSFGIGFLQRCRTSGADLRVSTALVSFGHTAIIKWVMRKTAPRGSLGSHSISQPCAIPLPARDTGRSWQLRLGGCSYLKFV
jgi:hypothetical protein